MDDLDLRDPRSPKELYRTFALIAHTVDRSYVSELGALDIFEPNFQIVEKKKSGSDNNVRELGENVDLLELTRFVYDEDESIQDKLVSVYQAVASFENAKIFMLIRNDEKEQKIYFGVCSGNYAKGPQLKGQLLVLKENMSGNFPGSRFKEFKDIPGENGKKRKEYAGAEKRNS